MEQNIKNLANAVLLQAAKDYCDGNDRERKVILKHLRSEWMRFLTNETSIWVADQLENNCAEIAQRLKRYQDDV